MLRSKGGHRLTLLAEAAAELAWAAAVVRFFPFRHAVESGSRPLRGEERGGAVDTEVVAAVETAARRVPWRTVCFQKGLAVQAMLRRRGVDAQLVYGVGKDRSVELTSHVWVVTGETIVVGGEEAPNYHPVARFPA